MTRLRFDYYEASDGWRWRLKARNGRIVADGGEAYSTEGKVRRAIYNLNESIVMAGQLLPMTRVPA